MSRSRAYSGDVFHRLLVRCLAEEHQPTDEEIDLVAGKIWQDSYGLVTGQPWPDVVPDSDAHRQMIGAAKMALAPPLRCEASAA
ncbi:hypothetical protein ASE85_02750 [Sphingobium sp. Leaf26]|uniref:hypothetical protein n=1 Tax=Sphingobium sp. Leaf26 TaxID=1735693 RepID=UPI0006FDF396|nr:hypothetical protein [Sphingobium sp. Leaf26]KQN09872.1 hypothetical protein ASE85_02750 [Sphingobium sp. Leaf26]